MLLYASMLVLAVLPRCVYQGVLPDRACTPGDVGTRDLAVICSQPTRERRANLDEALRRSLFASYGIPWRLRSRYELDHLVPLAVGGSNDSANLWPEPREEALRKDRVEAQARRDVCANPPRAKLDDVQFAFEQDWTILER